MPATTLELTAHSEGARGALLSWRGPYCSFEHRLTRQEIAALAEMASTLLELRGIRPVAARAGLSRSLRPISSPSKAPRKKPLIEFGERLGQCAVGPKNAFALLEAVHMRRQQFTLVRVGGDEPELISLPWEALVLPGDEGPLLFHPFVRGWLDFARDCEQGSDIARRRAALKCLASWSLPAPGELLVQPEMDELCSRLTHHPQVRFRWLHNPPLEELRTRLRLECALFLYAGHGTFDRGVYNLHLADRPTDAGLLQEELRTALTEVLIFDSCESGLGWESEGLPGLLRRLPSATCLLGMQGPASDIVSRSHVPALVERLLIGRPVWEAVNLLRIDLYEQGRDDWLLPVMYLKRGYQPFPVAARKRSYLDAVLNSLEHP